MTKGFNFNIDRCVACHACLVACSLENGPDMPWRKIAANDEKQYPGLPVHNISMACNHCEDAPCMKGCPTNAYYRDELYGTIQIIPERCIGCQYCYWNCPYDAPVYNAEKKVIEKCNLCFGRLKEGISPACVSACPTGALCFSEINTDNKQHYFTDSGTLPALSVYVSDSLLRPKPQIAPPENILNNQSPESTRTNKTSVYKEWSLIVFTYMTSLLFAINISNWYGNVKVTSSVYILLTALTLIVPFLHLGGKRLTAWKSMAGLFKSPLSNEIVSLFLFSISSVPAYLFYVNELWMVSFVAGFLMLVSVDSVYTFSDSRFSFKIHPGQSFLSGLLMASYLLDAAVPFIFISILKFFASIYYIYTSSRQKGFIIFTIIQSLLMIFLITEIYSDFEIGFVPLSLLFLSELAGRIFYYIHFSPVSLIRSYFDTNIFKNEKTKTG